MSAIDEMIVLADGTQANPSDVSRGDDGVYRHKNGMAAAMAADGKPMTIADRTANNKAAADAGKKEEKPPVEAVSQDQNPSDQPAP